MMPMAMGQQGQPMMGMMPMAMGQQGQQMMMMPMTMQGQQSMPMGMAMGPQGQPIVGQPMMAMGANQTLQQGQQHSQPGPEKDKLVAKTAAKSGAHAKEPKQGTKLKNTSLSGAG